MTSKAPYSSQLCRTTESKSRKEDSIVMKQEYLDLVHKAKAILQRNTVTVTVNGKDYQRIIPSRDFYVHQWLWDTAGIAMGRVHIDEEGAFNDLLSLIAGQWNNGLIPH